MIDKPFEKVLMIDSHNIDKLYACLAELKAGSALAAYIHANEDGIIVRVWTAPEEPVSE